MIIQGVILAGGQIIVKVKIVDDQRGEDGLGEVSFVKGSKHDLTNMI